jgi:N-terminal acetyltransferase B complex non-catalytic subunit
VNYANALADWLEPYHDHARPPPSVVLAEAAKLAESKTGHPLKGVEIPPKSGNGTPNGSTKKDEEAPPINEAPEIVVRYFDGMRRAKSGFFPPFYELFIRYEKTV